MEDEAATIRQQEKEERARKRKEPKRAVAITHAQKAANRPTATLCGVAARPARIILGGAFRRDTSRINCPKCLELHWQILARASKHHVPQPKPKPDMWELLKGRIQEYTEVAVAESWKGGGDPADMEIHELRLKLTWIELCNHIARMKEELT